MSKILTEEWAERDVWTDWELACLLCGEMDSYNHILISMGIGQDYSGLRIPVPNSPDGDLFFIPKVSAVFRDAPMHFSEQYLWHLTVNKLSASNNLDFIRRAIIAENLAAKKIEPEPTGTNQNLSARYYLKPSVCVRWWRKRRGRRIRGSKAWEILAERIESSASATTKPKQRPSREHETQCKKIAKARWEKEIKDGKKPLTSARSLAKMHSFQTSCIDACDGKKYSSGKYERWIGPMKTELEQAAKKTMSSTT